MVHRRERPVAFRLVPPCGGTIPVCHRMRLCASGRPWWGLVLARAEPGWDAPPRGCFMNRAEARWGGPGGHYVFADSPRHLGHRGQDCITAARFLYSATMPQV